MFFFFFPFYFGWGKRNGVYENWPGLCEFGILDYEGVVFVCVNPTLNVC